MEKIIAVVVTHNRSTLLSECITALRNQTHKPDAILVVNNGSADNTEQWLSSQKDVFFITQKNVGSSGGFNTGINWAYKNNYSWIWCMDDDGYPKEDALEKILAAQTETLCLRNCAVLNKTDKKSFVWKTKNYTTIDEVDTRLIKGIGYPFNGTMLHRNIVERVGLPKPNLFLWGDETEYYYRITKTNKIPVYTVADSIHYHPASTFTFKKDWDYKNSWKMYYYVRNRFQIQQSKVNNKLLALV
ncbi:MAG: glycosyltransferase family 2 protein [Ferruginibacter sp.]